MKEYTELVEVITATCGYLNDKDSTPVDHAVSGMLQKAMRDYAATLKPALPADSGSLTDKDRAIVLMYKSICEFYNSGELMRFEMQAINKLLGFNDE